MSGVLNVLSAGGRSAAKFTVDVVNTGGTGNWGYNPSFSPSGSISTTTFRNTTIKSIFTPSPLGYDLGLSIEGTLTQSFIDSVFVIGDGGARTFLSVDATFIDFGTFVTWRWGSGSNPVWTSAASRLLLIRY